jgi:acyl-CoA synthetase (AMP-forming)/AMP-acid ligase II
VAEAVVIGVPDQDVGHRLRAVVVLRAGETGPLPNAAALRDHCARRLPRYMVPEFLELRDSLPRTPSGKVDRTALAAGEATPRKDPV